MGYVTPVTRSSLFLSIALLLTIYCDAQDNVFPTEKELEMKDFTVRSCGNSPRVERLIRKTIGKDTATKDYFFFTIKLSDSDFISLTPFEKFVYAHHYPENYMQNCSWYNAPDGLKKLYANLPFITTGLKMSKRQTESLKNNRDSTLKYLEDCIKGQDQIALGYKQTILDMNAWEFVPIILDLESYMYSGNKKVPKDTYLYTVLMQLMKQGDFPGFKKTSFYTRMFGPDSRYRETIDLTPGIRKEIIDLAGNFYRWKHAQTN